MPLGIIAGTLIASALQGLFGIGSTIAQNQYNSPKAMKRRLRQAGLPLSYMYRGNVAQQSEAPKLSIDPSLGVEKKLSLDNQTKLANAQVTKLDIENQINAGIQDWLQNHGKVGVKGFPDGTNQEINLQLDQNEKQAASFVKKYEMQLKQIQKDVEMSMFAEGVTQEQRRQAVARAKQQIKNLVTQEGLMDQLSDIRDFDAWLNSTITENITSLPKWAQAIAATVLKAASYK